MAAQILEFPLRSGDDAAWQLRIVAPPEPRARLLWVPAMGVAARHYEPFAMACAARGIVVGLHELRGAGSSDRRAARAQDWGYRELLIEDVPASMARLRETGRGPMLIGGHSLGAQLACLSLALRPEAAAGLVVVAGGSPYWRCFPGWQAPAFRLALSAIPPLCRAVGHFPGRRLGFAGREACGVIRDWARSARTGGYRPDGMPDMQPALARLACPTLTLHCSDDPLVPGAALQYLMRLLPNAAATHVEMDAARLGTRANHFAWMKSPEAVAEAVAGWIRSDIGYSILDIG